MAYTPNSTWVDGSGGGTPISAARLNNMEAGIVLGIAPAAARAYHNANQSITSGALTPLALNSERFDTDTIHDTVTNNSRLTCKTAGKYQIVGGVEFAANATGVRQANLLLNGGTRIGRVAVASAGGALATILTVTALYDLAVNDYVELEVYQDSGGPLNVTSAANYSPEVSIVRVA